MPIRRSEISEEAGRASSRKFALIGSEEALGDTPLLSAAIADLADHASADAVRVEEGGLTVVVIRAERLRAAGLDVATLAEAIEVLGHDGRGGVTLEP